MNIKVHVIKMWTYIVLSLQNNHFTFMSDGFLLYLISFTKYLLNIHDHNMIFTKMWMSSHSSPAM